MGGPSVAHDDFEVRALKLPTQEFASALVARDRRRWISGTALGEANFEVDTGNSLHGFDDLAIRVADARTEIEDEFGMNVEGRDCQHVGLSEVAHVDVVTNTRSVGRRIVVAVDVEMASMTSGNVQRYGNEVNLWPMAFGVRNRPPRGIEVTQHRSTHALANFKDLARAIVVDGAMNVWLDNNDNYIQSPNENLAREFMELMTLGVNKFTQHDVTAAARALTGYSTDQSNGNVTFNAKQHFSTPLTVLGTTSKLNAESLASLIVSKDENTKFITDRMWFRFVSGSTTPPASLARSFADRDISSLVSALVHSSAWSNPANSLVKSPVEWFVGACRALKVRPSTLNPENTKWELQQMGQNPFNPPNVGGWPFGQAWLSGVAYQYRFQLAQSMVTSADLAPLSVPKSKMVQACADWLGVPEWSRRTASTLAAATGTPSELALAALLSPEYMVSA